MKPAVLSDTLSLFSQTLCRLLLVRRLRTSSLNARCPKPTTGTTFRVNPNPLGTPFSIHHARVFSCHLRARFAERLLCVTGIRLTVASVSDRASSDVAVCGSGALHATPTPTIRPLFQIGGHAISPLIPLSSLHFRPPLKTPSMNAIAKSPNHALQRTAPCVTAPASAAAFPPAMQVPRRPPRSLSLGSLGVFHAPIHQ